MICKQQSAYEWLSSLVGAEMCIRERYRGTSHIRKRPPSGKGARAVALAGLGPHGVKHVDMHRQSVTDEGVTPHPTPSTLRHTPYTVHLSLISFRRCRRRSTC